MQGNCILPADLSMAPDKSNSKMNGIAHEKMRKYCEAPSTISAPPPNHSGMGRWSSTPTKVMNKLNTMPQTRACRYTWRALGKSLAPIKCATCTEKPVEAAINTLPNNQIVGSMRPILAEAAVPRCPTMLASMKNIITVVSCANIDGILKLTMSRSFSPRVMGNPLRMLANNLSLLLLPNISV